MQNKGLESKQTVCLFCRFLSSSHCRHILMTKCCCGSQSESEELGLVKRRGQAQMCSRWYKTKSCLWHTYIHMLTTYHPQCLHYKTFSSNCSRHWFLWPQGMTPREDKLKYALSLALLVFVSLSHTDTQAHTNARQSFLSPSSTYSFEDIGRRTRTWKHPSFLFILHVNDHVCFHQDKYLLLPLFSACPVKLNTFWEYLWVPQQKYAGIYLSTVLNPSHHSLSQHIKPKGLHSFKCFVISCYMLASYCTVNLRKVVHVIHMKLYLYFLRKSIISQEMRSIQVPLNSRHTTLGGVIKFTRF